MLLDGDFGYVNNRTPSVEYAHAWLPISFQSIVVETSVDFPHAWMAVDTEPEGAGKGKLARHWLCFQTALLLN